MACQCADLCGEYGNCSVDMVDGLQSLVMLTDPLPHGVESRHRCPSCGQVWELWRVEDEGQRYPWVVKQGVLPGPLQPPE